MNNLEVQIKQVNNLQELSSNELSSAEAVYIRAFAILPYQELFTKEESLGALQYILDKNGDLLVGQGLDGSVVSLAGGYLNEENDYFIEELAVDPDKQRQGIGRETLLALIDLGLKRNPNALEIRTTASNSKAIPLYKEEGFTLSNIREVVAKKRQDGKIGLDERVYLRKSIKEESMQTNTSKLQRVAIAYPSGNTTAVIFDQLYQSKSLTNDQVMNAWGSIADGQPGVEQCCYVTLPYDKRAIARVQMFGNEFCGNATRSVIRLLTEGKDYEGMIEVSGVAKDRPLNFNVSNGIITLEMPLPDSKDQLVTEVEEGILVRLDGIAQLVVIDQGQNIITPREMVRNILKQNKYGLADQAAFGVTFYDPISTKAQFCVWVGGGLDETIFDETACGSGTSAIGIASAFLTKQNQNLDVFQPSGESIRTIATFNNNQVASSYISGSVDILYDGKLKYDK